MTNLPPKLEEFVSSLELLGDRSDRITFLIDIAERFEDVSPDVATRPFPANHRTPACESEAYVWATPNENGTLNFHFAVENPQGISAKALAVILKDTLSGEPLDRVAIVSADVVYEIFGKELSMGKSMGLMGMISMVQAFAKHARDAAD